MNQAINLANRFREVMLYGTWIANTNYWNQLTSIDFHQVNQSIYNLNSIGNIARHIHYYVSGVKQVLLGGPLDISDKYSFNFEPLADTLEWKYFLEKFKTDAEEFAGLVEQMEDADLDRIFIDERYGDYRRNIEGMIEHCYYHLGQIVLIGKLLRDQ